VPALESAAPATVPLLSRPIDPRHLKIRQQGGVTLTYCPWHIIARHLHHRAPEWCWEVQSVQEVEGAVVVTGRLTIPSAYGDLLHYSAVASEPLESASKAPAAADPSSKTWEITPKVRFACSGDPRFSMDRSTAKQS